MRLFKKLYDLDKLKYLPPRFDTAFRELAGYIFSKKEELGLTRNKGGGAESSLNLSFSSTSQVSSQKLII